jgi:hypothetical protein
VASVLTDCHITTCKGIEKVCLPLTSKTHSCNINFLLSTRNVELNVAYKIINMTNITE